VHACGPVLAAVLVEVTGRAVPGFFVCRISLNCEARREETPPAADAEQALWPRSLEGAQAAFRPACPPGLAWRQRCIAQRSIIKSPAQRCAAAVSISHTRYDIKLCKGHCA
jgi:hypothetical protein